MTQPREGYCKSSEGQLISNNEIFGNLALLALARKATKDKEPFCSLLRVCEHSRDQKSSQIFFLCYFFSFFSQLDLNFAFGRVELSPTFGHTEWRPSVTFHFHYQPVLLALALSKALQQRSCFFFICSFWIQFEALSKEKVSPALMADAKSSFPQFNPQFFWRRKEPRRRLRR